VVAAAKMIDRMLELGDPEGAAGLAADQGCDRGVTGSADCRALRSGAKRGTKRSRRPAGSSRRLPICLNDPAFRLACVGA
jgi:hypothetical protein